MDIVNWFTENWKDVTDFVAYGVLLASIAVRFTKTPKDNIFLANVVAFLKLISLYKEPEE